MTFHQMFSDIRLGKTKASMSDNIFYFKHIGIDETSEIEDFYESIYAKAIESGRLTRKQILDKCKKDGSWSSSDQDSLDNLTRDIKAFSAKRNLGSSSKEELWSLNDEIKEMTKLINNLEHKKIRLTSDSAESYADDRALEKRLQLSLFSDEALSKHMFSEEDLENIDDLYYNSILNLYVDFLASFSIEKLKNLSVRRFVQTLFSVTQDEFKIFNIPIIDLSMNQLHLLRFGKYYRTLLDEIREIEDDDIVNPERIEEVFLESKVPKKEKSKK